MKHKNIILIALVICVIIVGVFIIFNKRTQPVNPNLYKKAIEQYWNNEDLFEEAKEYLINMPNDIYIYRDINDKNNILIDAIKDGLYRDIEIDEDFDRIFVRLFEEFDSMDAIYKMDAILYGMDNVEDTFVKFELTGVIQSKGIVYIVSSSEEEVKSKLVLTKCQFLKENWYYYEEPGGV